MSRIRKHFSIHYETKQNKTFVSRTRTQGRGVWWGLVFYLFLPSPRRNYVESDWCQQNNSNDVIRYTCRHELQSLWLLSYLCSNFLSYATAPELQLNQIATTHNALSEAFVALNQLLYMKQYSGKHNKLENSSWQRLNNWLFTEHEGLVCDHQTKGEGAWNLVGCTSLP